MTRRVVPSRNIPLAAGSGRSDFFNPFPRYLQIRNILVRRLADGYSPGDRFPTEHQLCSEFGVSRETIREALLGLENEGLIARYRGRGSVVVRLPDGANDERLTGLVEDFTELRLDTHADVLKAGVERLSPRIAAALQLDREAERFRIVRLRRLDGRPFAYHDAFLPPDVGSRVAGRDLSRTTLFRELGRLPGVKLTEIYQRIEAVAADVRIARLLEVDVGAPLLLTRRAIDHAGEGTPTMLFETYFRADRYYYSVQVDARSAPAGRAAGNNRTTGRKATTKLTANNATKATTSGKATSNTARSALAGATRPR